MNRTRLGILWRLVARLTIAQIAVLLPCEAAWAAKNVILMVADGAGENAWLAASMYQGKVGKQVYDRPGWLRLSCSTHPLNLSRKPTGDDAQDRSLIYDPRKAWDAAIMGPGGFAGYVYLKTTCTDSAAAATALATGRKTYNNAVNWSNDNRPMRGRTIAEIAKVQGKSVGVVTTVQWSDATPACLGGAHNASRKNRAEIAHEMLGAAWLDVIMGAGNPDFDDDGQPLPDGRQRDYQYVGGPRTWQSLKSGRRAWKLIESKVDVEALKSGPTPPKVLATVEVANTLQEKRSRAVRNCHVPTLAAMTRAAINCLDDNAEGFYLMIEGGAVDWANHANQPDRMVEEQIDFLKAVEAVVDWVDKNSNWDDTLLILTADHQCGLLWGPESSQVAYQPLVDRGAGKLPGMAYNCHGHGNGLVPLYARGSGSRRFAELVAGKDPQAAQVWHCSGRYVDNTDIFTIMKAEVIGMRYWGIDYPERPEPALCR